jgi:hypothetical protein
LMSSILASISYKTEQGDFLPLILRIKPNIGYDWT